MRDGIKADTELSRFRRKIERFVKDLWRRPDELSEGLSKGSLRGHSSGLKDIFQKSLKTLTESSTKFFAASSVNKLLLKRKNDLELKSFATINTSSIRLRYLFYQLHSINRMKLSTS